MLSLLFVFAIVALIFLASIFWIWMLVDCAAKDPDPNGKIVWILIILFTHTIGALLYFFVRRPRRFNAYSVRTD